VTDWDLRFSEPGFAYGTAPNAFLRSVVHHIPPGPVLALAEGEGRNAVFLAGHGHPVTAVDLSAVGMAKAQRLAAERGLFVCTVVADLAEIGIATGYWSGIVIIFGHFAPPLRARLHREIAAGLVPGGVYVLEAYTPRQLAFGTGGPSDPTRLVTLADVRAELPGLTFEIGHEIEREVVEGRMHTGRAAVVQVLARKPTGSG
jgi:hypothetical protein